MGASTLASWDDPKSLWKFHSGFPQGFGPVAQRGVFRAKRRRHCVSCLTLLIRLLPLASLHFSPLPQSHHTPAKDFQSGIGVWVSPWGGYGEAKDARCVRVTMTHQSAASGPRTRRVPDSPDTQQPFPRHNSIAFGKAAGYEVTDEGFSLSGKNYFKRFTGTGGWCRRHGRLESEPRAQCRPPLPISPRHCARHGHHVWRQHVQI